MQSIMALQGLALAALALLAVLPSFASADKIEGHLTPAPPVIPPIYQILCVTKASGYQGPTCDGRIEYCDDTNRPFCGSCKKACQPGQSIYQCQADCKMYLEFNAKAARDQALEQRLNAHLDKKLELMDTRRKTERKEMKERLDTMAAHCLGLMIAMIVCGAFLIIALVKLIYIMRTVRHVPDYRPVFQPEVIVKPDEMAESGILTGPGNTPASTRRMVVETQAQQVTAQPDCNFVANPTDANPTDARPIAAHPPDAATEAQATP